MTMQFLNIRAIPVNSEKTLQFQIKKHRFHRFVPFLAVSLDTLVSTLKRAGKQKFVQTTKYLGDDDLVFEKGHFPYAYFDSLRLRCRQKVLLQRSHRKRHFLTSCY